MTFVGKRRNKKLISAAAFDEIIVLSMLYRSSVVVAKSNSCIKCKRISPDGIDPMRERIAP